MKALTRFFILLLIVISGCEKPCDPPIKKLNPQTLELFPDDYSITPRYKNSDSKELLFDSYNYNPHVEYSPNKCNGGAEHLTLTYSGDNNVGEIQYGMLSSSKTLHLFIGKTGFSQQYYYLKVDTFNAHLTDTFSLFGETYYDVYEGSGFCFSKQYGIVAFKWEGEWLVLDK